MEQRVDIITVRVSDMEAATSYYVERLGWRAVLAVPGEVTFLQIAHGQVLALFDAAGFDEDLGPTVSASFNLAHNVSSEAEVDALVNEMLGAGATLLRAPQRAPWGGYHGFVLDPAGCCWEIAHNAGWSIGPDGAVSIGPAS